MPLILPEKTSEKLWTFLSNWFEEKSQRKPVKTKQPDWSVLDVDRELEEETWKHRFFERMHLFCWGKTRECIDAVFLGMSEEERKKVEEIYKSRGL